MVGPLSGKGLAQIGGRVMKMGRCLENGRQCGPFPVMVFDPFVNGPGIKMKWLVHGFLITDWSWIEKN
jgi:hypothetical protein